MRKLSSVVDDANYKSLNKLATFA